MPTDNPKISLYVPQQIYDRFRDFQKDQHLSMSQAGIVILAEYFGIKETIKEITEGTTIGGVTLAEFEDLKDRVLELEKKVEYKKSTSKLQGKNPTTSGSLQLNLPSEPLKNIGLKGISIDLLEKRLILSDRSQILKNLQRYKNAPDKFFNWSRKKDFDKIGWIPEAGGDKYTPGENLSDVFLNKLKVWIKENQ